MTKININDLSLGEIKELSALINPISNTLSNTTQENLPTIISSLIGKKVIIRTYSAGVFFGELVEKTKDEVILKNARRLYFWKTTDGGLSLSEVALTGLHKDSKVCAPTNLHWMQAIEIIPCTNESINSIESQNDFKA